MTIYLDFDGTVVEHQYPSIGRENFGCFPVIKRLMEAGHKVILNTYRANLDKESLEKALAFINLHYIHELPYEITATTEKHQPPPWNWSMHHETGVMYIDDQATYSPLKPAVMTNGKMVDWVELDRQFELHGMYKPIEL